MRYPASLDLVVKRAVKDAIEAVKAKHPRYTDESMEVTFLPAKPAHLAVVGREMDGEADETPVAADAVGDSSDGA